ncbi:ABC transporter ATP-binding protein [Bacillus subtilis]
MEIKLEHVSKKYGRHTAVNDVSITLSSGRIYGLIGPNGSGKSTTLKMMAGLLFPTSGFVKVDEEQVTREMVHQTAYLTELDMFYPHFTVKDMVNFYQSQFPDFQTEQAYKLLNEMQLNPEKKIKKLSKGNRGRLKIVLALARRADVIVLDEPFSGLDPMVRDSIVNSLVSYIDFEQQIVVIATHEIDEIDEIETLLDEVIILANGEKVAQREVEDIREQEGMSVLQWFKSKMEVC